MRVLCLLLILLCLVYGLRAQEAQTDSTRAEIFSSEGEAYWTLALDVYPDFSHIIAPGDYLERWSVGAKLGYRVQISRHFAGPFNLDSGLRWQKTRSTGTIEHPEPYVFWVDLNLETESIRIPLVLNWKYFRKEGINDLYLGVGTFVDWVYEKEIRETRTYVGSTLVENRELTELGSFVPGAMLQLGTKSGRGRVELQAWTDLMGFRLDELGDTPLRRSGLSLHFFYEILQF